MITVDDFGISLEANRIVEKAIKAEVITHVSVMTNMPASKHAFKIINKHQGIAYGLHLNLTEPFLGLGKLEDKIRQQIKTLRKITKINFINSHHHIHLLPIISKIVVKLAKQNNIEYIRRPQKIWLSPVLETKLAKALAIQIAGALVRPDGLKSPDYFVDLDWFSPTDLSLIAKSLPSNAEISCHPLTSLSWLIENKNQVN